MSQPEIKRSANTPAFLFALIKNHPDRLKLLLSGWYLLLALLTFAGSGSLLSTTLHPLYLVLTLVFLPLLFLILTLFHLHSFFGRLFLNLLTLLPIKSMALSAGSQSASSNPTLPSSTQNRLYFTLLSFITHSSWLVIFIALSLLLAIKFSLQHYDFYLSSTLFSNEHSLYQRLFSLINALPTLLKINPIDPELIVKTLTINQAESSLDDLARAQWAQWILMIILLYGLLPRLIATLTTLFRAKRQWQALNQSAPILERPSHNPKPQAPKVERDNITIKGAKGKFFVAIECIESPLIAPYQPQYLNSIEAYNDFYQMRQRAPAAQLILFIDANQTPDRGVLRRLTRLMNYASESRLYCIPFQPHQPNRYEEWARRLTPLLNAHEQLYPSLDTLHRHS